MSAVANSRSFSRPATNFDTDRSVDRVALRAIHIVSECEIRLHRDDNLVRELVFSEAAENRLAPEHDDLGVINDLGCGSQPNVDTRARAARGSGPILCVLRLPSCEHLSAFGFTEHTGKRRVLSQLATLRGGRDEGCEELVDRTAEQTFPFVEPLYACPEIRTLVLVRKSRHWYHVRI